MGYVYKVQGDFESIDFEKVLDKILNDFVFIYLDDTLFVALKDFNNNDKSKNIIKNAINSDENEYDFAITEITKKNIDKLNEVSKDWCLNHLVRLDTDKYQFDKQNQLKAEWIAMDFMEEELNKKIKRKEV